MRGGLCLAVDRLYIRGGGTRTPDLRFWRPPLYQLSYAPRFDGQCSPAAGGATRSSAGLALDAGPPGAVTVIGPVVFPPATTKVIFLSDLTSNDWTSTPFTCTAEAPQKPVPLRFTLEPTCAFFGPKDLIVGTGEGSTVNVGAGNRARGPSYVRPGRRRARRRNGGHLPAALREAGGLRAVERDDSGAGRSCR